MSTEESTKTFEVCLAFEAYCYFNIDAEDEDEAREVARDNWREYISAGDLEVEGVNIESVDAR